MRRIDLSNASWRASSYSNGDGGQCIEVADHFPTVVPVRDSKIPQGPALVFPSGTRSSRSLRPGLRSDSEFNFSRPPRHTFICSEELPPDGKHHLGSRPERPLHAPRR
jgi:hypothetical protein